MQSENPLIADFVKLANAAAGTFAGMTREARDGARERMREAFGGMDFVSREEFDAVKDMAARAREEADEHGPLAGPGERDRSTVDEHLERPEKSVLGRHGATLHRDRATGEGRG